MLNVRLLRFCPILFVFLFAFLTDSWALDQKTGIKIETGLIANAGKLNSEVLFSARVKTGKVFLTPSGAVYNFINREGNQGFAIKEVFEGAKPLKYRGEGENDFRINYIRNARPTISSKAYSSVTAGELWPGVELFYVARPNNVEKVFKISPHNPVSKIKVGVQGTDDLAVLESGELRVGKLVFSKPLAYQVINGKNVQISAKYLLRKGGYEFSVGEYNSDYPLIIDPIISSTYLGSSLDDFISRVRHDPSTGSVYVYGYTFGNDLPTTLGAYSGSVGDADAFVARFDRYASTLVALTYFGGTGTDVSHDMVISATGNVYLSGYTTSTNFPVGVSSLFGTICGGSDIFLIELSADLSTRVQSTYWGSCGIDYGSSLALTSEDNLVVVISTDGSDAPISSLAVYDTSHNGNTDLHIAVIASGLSATTYASYLGGSGFDVDPFVSVASDNSIYVLGRSASADYPTTVGAYQTVQVSSVDLVVSHLSANLNSLLASTYIGGFGNEISGEIIVENSGSVLLTGTTNATDFPTTSGSYDSSHNGVFDNFVTRMNGDLTQVQQSTFFGGSSTEDISRIELTSDGRIVMASSTQSNTDFPTSTDAIQPIYGGGDRDSFVAILSQNLSQLVTVTYLGGSGNDYFSDIAINSADSIYLVGYTTGIFPLSGYIIDTTPNGGIDGFIAMLGRSLKAFPGVERVYSTPSSGVYTTGQTVNFTVEVSDEISGLTISGATPAITLETGATDRTIVNGSPLSILDTRLVNFAYTVQAGDSSADLDYTSSSSFAAILQSGYSSIVNNLPEPGATGSLSNTSNIVIDTTDTDSDGTPNPTDTDDDNDGLSDVVESLTRTNPLVADTDCDGVGDGTEVTEGTDPREAASLVFRLGTSACGEWNGFLGVYNVLEHINYRGSSLPVASELFSIGGISQSMVGFNIASGAQFDLLVHDMPGRITDSYGRVCSTISGVASPGEMDGRMVYYRPVPGSTTSFQFAFALPLQAGSKGSQFVPFNTFQPSLDLTDQSNLVANWLQVNNEETSAQSGQVIIYGQSGDALLTIPVSLGSRARQDIDIHRVGTTRVGLVEWRPDSSTARFQVRNVRYMYDNSGSVNSFDTAFQLEAGYGNGNSIVTPLDTSSGSAILEVANTLATTQSVSVTIYSSAGVLLNTMNFTLPPRATQHIITDTILGGGQGIAVVDGSGDSSVIAIAMHYGRTSTGGLSFMYGIRAQEGLGSSLRGSYNTFLGQSCRLLIANPSSTAQNTTIQVRRQDGTQLLSGQVLSIPAHGLLNYDLCAVDASNNYGVVSLTPEQRNSLTATVLRIGGGTNRYRFPTPVR